MIILSIYLSACCVIIHSLLNVILKSCIIFLGWRCWCGPDVSVCVPACRGCWRLAEEHWGQSWQEEDVWDLINHRSSCLKKTIWTHLLSPKGFLIINLTLLPLIFTFNLWCFSSSFSVLVSHLTTSWSWLHFQDEFLFAESALTEFHTS